MSSYSDELRDLIERNATVQEMAQHQGWALLEDYIRAQMEAKQTYLLTGNADSMEEYNKITGWIAGVRAVLNSPWALDAQTDRQKKEEEANANEQARYEQEQVTGVHREV